MIDQQWTFQDTAQGMKDLVLNGFLFGCVFLLHEGSGSDMQPVISFYASLSCR